MIFKDDNSQLCWKYCMNSDITIAIPNKYSYIGDDEGLLFIRLAGDGVFAILNQIAREIYEHGNKRTIEKEIERLDRLRETRSHNDQA